MKSPEFLTARVSWSKNVKDQSNCPQQIIVPDMDPRTCVHTASLALFLEADLQCGNGAHPSGFPAWEKPPQISVKQRSKMQKPDKGGILMQEH